MINHQGIQHAIKIPLTDAAMDKMTHSASTLKRISNNIFDALD